MFDFAVKRKMIRGIIALVCISFLILLIPFPAFAADNGGSCGAGVTWSLSEDGILTIRGNGDMTNFNEANHAPWYEMREQVRAVIIESGVTSVGNLAFYGCTSMASVSIPNTVWRIGDYAFMNCKRMKMLSLGSSVESIGRSAFECCESLLSVRLPDTLKKIGSKAFYRCYFLQMVTIPQWVETLGDQAFAYCSSLVSVNVKARIANLPVWLFYGCTSLTEISMTEATTSAGEYAFQGCERLGVVYYNGSEVGAQTLIQDIQKDVSNFSDTNLTYGVKPETESSSSSNVWMDGEKTLVVDSVTVKQTENMAVSTTTSSSFSIEKDTIVPTGKQSLAIQAVLENAVGWRELVEQIRDDEQKLGNSSEKIDVSIRMNHDNSEISSEMLTNLAGKNVDLTVDMKNGSTVTIDCERITGEIVEKLPDKYTFTYSLSRNENPSKSQMKTIGNATSFLLSFDDNTVLDHSPSIYLGEDAAMCYATLYQNNPGKGLERIQAVVVDKDGYATFYLSSTKATTNYLIALNVEGESIDTSVIPPTLYKEYGITDTYEEIQYVVTGVRMFMGMSLFQFTIVIIVLMIALVIGIGVVMFVFYRKKRLELMYKLKYEGAESV